MIAEQHVTWPDLCIGTRQRAASLNAVACGDSDNGPSTTCGGLIVDAHATAEEGLRRRCKREFHTESDICECEGSTGLSVKAEQSAVETSTRPIV